MDLVEKTRNFVAEKIADGFHHRRLRKLKKAKLSQLLAKRDTLLIRAEGANNARAIVRQRLDAHIASADASLFNDFMKSVATFVATQGEGTGEPRDKSVDAEFTRGDKHYAMLIKSRPDWGSKGQVTKMVDAFRAADAGGRPTDVHFLIGCLHGEGASNPTPESEKLCGADFWSFISGVKGFDTHLIEFFDIDTEGHSKKYTRAYKGTLKSLTEEFQREFCDDEGNVRWDALLAYVPPNATDEDEPDDHEDADSEEEAAS